MAKESICNRYYDSKRRPTLKLVDQYIYAIRKKLPYNSRKDITSEIRSLILDNIEAKYGDNPTKEQVEEFLSAYGAPSKVANQYRNDRFIIGTGLTDLYFLIMKIILFALSLGFSVEFIVTLFQNKLTAIFISTGLLDLLLNIFNSILPSIGCLTLVFIIITRLYKDQIIDLDEDWTPNELKDIEVSPKVESIFESIFAIIFIIVALVFINISPALITIAENLFETSTLELGHRINIDVFKKYLIFISISWFLDIIYHIFILVSQEKTKAIAIFDIIKESIGLILLSIMVFDSNLFTNFSNALGFRSIFAIIAIIASFELISKIYKFFKFYVFNLN